MNHKFFKSFVLIALMMCSLGAWAVDWSTIGWVGASNNKFKVGADDEANLPSVINVQQPGFAAEPGIYMTFPAADITCSHNCAIQGAGIVLYTSQFTTKETEVTVNYAGGSKTFIVYYEDGLNATLKKDYNYARNAVATASTGNAAAGCDGNTGTRWESASEDPQWWQVDLGENCIFNTIKIIWEGAYAKTFTISVSEDGTDWTVKKSIENVTLGGFPNTQMYDLEEDVTARYVRFDGTVRGTGYGYSFWEFEVLYPNVSVLTSLTLSAAATMAQVGTEVNLTVGAKDQNNTAMEPGEVEWVVTPAAAGHVTIDGKYVADQAGTATIKAVSGTVESPEVSVFAYAGTNLSLSTNIGTDNKVIAQSEFAPNGTDAFFAVDANEGSVYQGSATNGTSDAEEDRTFDSWFVLDLGAYYTIEVITIKFEGACSQEYHIDFAEAYNGESTDWTTAYNYVGRNGINGHTDVWNDNVLASQKVRFVRFFSTKAATQWGMKIYDLKVIGTAWVPSDDNVAPVMGTATLASAGWNKVVLNVTATDNVEVAAYHVVDAANGIDLTVPAAAQITVNGLTASTAYNFTVTAKDLVGNESANSVVVPATTAPHNFAPIAAAPAVVVRASANVKVAYSDAYDYNSVVEKHAGWGDATVVVEEDIEGNSYLKASNLNWWGWTLHAMDASAMEYLHIDIWSENDSHIGIVPIYGGTGLTTDDSHRKIVNVVGQQWNSFDLVLSTDFAGLDLSSIFQFKFDNAEAENVYALDNVYFWKEGNVSLDLTTNNGWASFSENVAMEISGATAYTAKVNAAKTAVILTEVPDGIIPANTGVLIHGTTSASLTEHADVAAIADNDLVAVVNGNVPAGAYVVGTKESVTALYALSAQKAVANKAYIPAALVAENKQLEIVLSEEVTGIENIEAVELDWSKPVYNVLGQRVAEGTCGILIQEGVKFIVK